MQLERINALAADALVESLQTMAFISAAPPEQVGDSPCPPPDGRRVIIEFTGPTSAVLELFAPAALGAVLAANLIACGPDDAAAIERADDALKELMNVACGALINGEEGFEMGIPFVATITPDEWRSVTSASGEAAVLDAEGCLLAIRVRVR
jgi:hypothetical protein